MKSRIRKPLQIASAMLGVAMLFTSTSAPAQTGASAQKTIVVPGWADFSGPYADIMPAWNSSRHAGLRWWNDKVGKNIGVTVTYKAYDGHYDPALISSLWPAVKSETNPIIMMGQGGPDATALKSRVREQQVPMLSPTGGYGFTWEANAWAFNARPPLGFEAGMFADWFRKEKLKDARPVRIAIIASEVSPAYVDTVKGIQAYAAASGGKAAVVNVMFRGAQPTDLTAEIHEISGHKPDFIVIMTNTAMVVAAKRALTSLSLQIPLLLGAHNGLKPAGKAMGGLEKMNGDYEAAVMPLPSDGGSKAFDFYTMLKKDYGLEGDWGVPAIFGIGQALLVAKTIEKAAAKYGRDNLTGPNIRKTIIETTYTAEESNGFWKTTRFDEDAPFPTKGMSGSIGTVADGKYVILTEEAAVPNIPKW